jgi:hypothetical protein
VQHLERLTQPDITRRKTLNARTKLNRANVGGSVVVAAIAGGLTTSWLVFCAVAVVLLGLSLNEGSIRLHPRRK